MKYRKYIGGKRRGVQARRTELEAMGDPFLNDALEGVDAVDADHGKVLAELDRRIAERVSSGKRRRYIAAGAAVAALCLFVGGGVALLLRDDGLTDTVAQGPAVEHQAEAFENVAADMALQADSVAPETDMARGTERSARKMVAEEKLSEESVVNTMMSADAEVADGVDVARQAAASGHESKAVAERIMVTEYGEPLSDRVVVRKELAVADTAVREVARVAAVMPAAPRQADQDSLKDCLDDWGLVAFGLDPGSSPTPAAENEEAARLEDMTVVSELDKLAKRLTILDVVIGSRFGKQPIVVYATVENEEFARYVSDNFKVQTDNEGDTVTGCMVLTFKVNRRGRPSNIEVQDGLSPKVDRYVVGLLRGGPDWPQVNAQDTVLIRLN